MCSVLLCAGCEGSNDVVILLDISGSLDSVYQIIMSFMHQIIYGLEYQQGRNRLALVTFADDADVRFNLAAYNVSAAISRPRRSLPVLYSGGALGRGSSGRSRNRNVTCQWFIPLVYN